RDCRHHPRYHRGNAPHRRIWSRFPYMFDWVLQLSRGRAAETIEVSAWSEMLLFLKSEKILIVVGTYICFAIGFATFTKKKLTNDGAIRFLAVYLAILACTAVMLSKRPNSYYLIPVLASGLPVLCVVIWRLFSVAPETRKKDLLIPKIAFVVVTGLMFFGPLVSTLQYDFRLLTQLRKDRIEHEKIPRKYNHCTLIGTYTSSLISYALAYGNSWAHELFNQDLRRLYPKFIQFRENGYSGFGNFGLPVSLDSLRKRVRDGECIFFYGSSGLGEQPPKSHEKFTLKAKESSGSETLFEILEIQGKH
ncbi:MAG TPA: hypothetical protein PLH57_03430, partial [Oligoflexia bacterium]|nr:hypothetical protein [Oligoflexia bacterium]